MEYKDISYQQLQLVNHVETKLNLLLHQHLIIPINLIF